MNIFKDKSEKKLAIKYHKMVECGNYGCRRLKPEKRIFCESCHREYLEDPGAFK